MARARSTDINILEATFAVWGVAVTLTSIGLAVGQGMNILIAAKWSAIDYGALAALYLFSALVTRVRKRGVFGLLGRRKRPRARAKRKTTQIPRGMLHRIDRRATKLIKQHVNVLARKRSQIRTTVDDYGNVDASKWRKEQDYFIEKTILATIRDEEIRKAFARRTRLLENWRRRIDDACARIDKKRADIKGLDFRPGMSGSEYEAFCAAQLSAVGWKIDNVRDTGDQGIDLVARKGSTIVAIQCKRYRSSVGNEAVQQIVAGKAIVAANARAAVVTNSTYTRSAKELAAANKVLLLHHDELQRLDALLANGGGQTLAHAA